MTFLNYDGPLKLIDSEDEEENVQDKAIGHCLVPVFDASL